MRNLLIFITKYNAFFLFLIFEISSWLSTSNTIPFRRPLLSIRPIRLPALCMPRWISCMATCHYGKPTIALPEKMPGCATSSNHRFISTPLAKHKVNDTIYKQQYTFIEAKVINNSINRSNNYITINRGSMQGVAKGMGVICSSGLVGKVVFVGDAFVHRAIPAA